MSIAELKKNQIIKIIADVIDVDISQVLPDKTFEELGVDSITFIRITVQCEVELGIQFDDEMVLVENYETINSLILYLDKCIKAK